jgi:hypothetical protein
MMAAALIKVRDAGSRRFAFMTSRGGTNPLRIHAARFEDKDGQPGEERAQRFINDMAAANPGVEFKVVAA